MARKSVSSAGPEETRTAKKTRSVRPKASAAAKKAPALKAAAAAACAGGGTLSPHTPSEQEEIARLAYTYWEARGGQGGSPEEDWYRAEQELKARKASGNGC